MPKRFVTFKENCRFKYYSDALGFMLGHLNKIMSDIPSLPDIMVTSVNDSTHSPHSRHYTDEALDIRLHNFTDALQKHTFLNQLVARLNTDPEAIKPNCFWGQIENMGTPNEHCHIQVKLGMKYE